MGQYELKTRNTKLKQNLILFIFLECSLFFSVLNELLVHWQSFPLAHSVHVPAAQHREREREREAKSMSPSSSVTYCTLLSLVSQQAQYSVPAGQVLRVCLLPVVQQLLLRGGHPERITGDHLREERWHIYKPELSIIALGWSFSLSPPSG